MTLGVSFACNQMKGEVHSEVSVPGHLLEELGLEPDTKLAYEADPESDCHIGMAARGFGISVRCFSVVSCAVLQQEIIPKIFRN